MISGVKLSVVVPQAIGISLRNMDALKEDNFGEKGSYSSLLPHLLMLESASLCPFGAHIVALPKIAFAL